MTVAEDALWGLRQDGRWLERYVEDFLEQIDLDIFPSAPARRRRISPAHPRPWTSTYRPNCSDRLPNSQHPLILQSSTCVFSPVPPTAAHSRLPFVAKSSPSFTGDRHHRPRLTHARCSREIDATVCRLTHTRSSQEICRRPRLTQACRSWKIERRRPWVTHTRHSREIDAACLQLTQSRRQPWRCQARQRTLMCPWACWWHMRVWGCGAQLQSPLLDSTSTAPSRAPQVSTLLERPLSVRTSRAPSSAPSSRAPIRAHSSQASHPGGAICPWPGWLRLWSIRHGLPSPRINHSCPSSLHRLGGLPSLHPGLASRVPPPPSRWICYSERRAYWEGG